MKNTEGSRFFPKFALQFTRTKSITLQFLDIKSKCPFDEREQPIESMVTGKQ